MPREKFLKRNIFITSLAAFLLLASSGGMAAGRGPESGQLRSFDARVETIGHRLAVASHDLCADRQWRPGIVLHSLAQYEGSSRDAAIHVFGLDKGPAILAVAAGGPAESAGLAADDILLGVDGEALPKPKGSGFAATEVILDAFERAFADGYATIDLLRRGERFTIPVPAELGCATRFQVVPKRSPDARADGVYVQLHLGLADHVEDDDELAAVIAHEFAHNILRHKARLSQSGRSSGRVRKTEIEAERMSVHLLHRAGFDPEAAIRFWTRFRRHGLNFLTSPTHPGWRRRIALFTEEIAAIRAAEAAGIRPVPSFLSAQATGSDADPELR